MKNAYDVQSLLAQAHAVAGVDQLGPDLLETLEAILPEAARFAASTLEPLNLAMDRPGCRLEDGRVKTAPGHIKAWAAFCEAGWPSLDKPTEHGGQGLPLLAWVAAQELFDRGSVAFGMPSAQLAGASRLVQAQADETTKALWLPRWTTGEWGASICISESDAGSDVGRIRTAAQPGNDGDWRITGEKTWITFGDSDLVPQIGHCLLARTPGAPAGGAGLSLFLVPHRLDDGSSNGVTVRRIEEKLGLHGSPTCALGFQAARGTMIGAEGRGLAQLFAMITLMRLSVGVQGLAVASGAAEIARAYAAERRQGGPASAPPIAIDRHADVQRMILSQAARVETLRGLVYAGAVQADIAALAADPEAAARAQSLADWFLPLIKTYGAETGFKVASEAIQVLGGAGYVRDWPLEQALRDSRIFAIYEGASGLQALDILHRRLWRDQGRGMQAFLDLARVDIAAHPGKQAQTFEQALDHLQAAAGALAVLKPQPREAEAGATAFLRLAALCACGWVALRLCALPQGSAAHGRLAAAGRFYLSDLEPQAALARARALAGSALLEDFDAL